MTDQPSFTLSTLIDFMAEHGWIEKSNLGKEILIKGFSSIYCSESNTLSWMKDQNLVLNDVKASVVICAKTFSIPHNCQIVFLPVSNPRYVFTKVLNYFSSTIKPKGIQPTTIVGENCKIGKDVYIGHYTVLGDNVVIGDNTEISHHAVIKDNTKIGKHCLIKSNTTIGEIGFGFVYEEDGTPLRISHIGNVEIGNNVEIGALSVIVQATMGSTVIEDNVKIDDQVFIAHNVHIGKNSMVIACAEISGSVVIGKNVWIGPGVSVRDGIKINDGALVGIGACVVKDIAKNEIVAGNPAKQMKKK